MTQAMFFLLFFVYTKWQEGKMMMKINLWLRKYAVPGMWGAGGCIVAALLCAHLLGQSTAANVFFIVGFVLAGIPILFRAIQGLRFKTVSIELLVSIAAIGACCIGEFSEAAIVTFLFQFGSFLEQKTMKKTRSAIKSLTEMAPSTAWRIAGDEIEEIDADEVEEEDILLVKTGNQIACDGIVTQGEGYATEASITGESVPRHKKTGDMVYAGTFLDSGTIQMKATRVGEDTTFSKIIELVEEAQDAKSPVERFIDRFARYYTPAVVVMAAVTFVITRNLDTAITVLVLACPGALVIGAPIANVAGIGRGAKEGILLKGGDSIHTFRKTDTVVFDKTGTLTQGRPQVVKEYTYTDDRERVLALAASVERATDHPLAQAVVQFAEQHAASFVEVDDVQPQKGLGVKAMAAGEQILVGNTRLMEQNGIKFSEKIRKDIQKEQNNGSSTVLLAVSGKITTLFAIADVIKPDAKSSIENLKKYGIAHAVMLTGDNASTAEAVSRMLGITEYQGELLPEDKLNYIRKLQKEGRTVTFVGDGINDSPALAAADTGIAMGSGTDVAIDSSDVVLIQSDLTSLVKAFRLAKKTVRITYQNIAIAIGTVLLLLVGLFAGYIHMSIGMLIHEASILVVIFNAMRLLFVRKGKEK